MISLLLSAFLNFSFATTPREFFSACAFNKERLDSRNCPYKPEEIKSICLKPENQQDCQKISEFFGARAKQAEAKILLTTAYSAQKMHEIDHGSFTSDLKKLWKAMDWTSKAGYVLAINPNCPGLQQSTYDLTTNFSPVMLQFKDQVLTGLRGLKVECKDSKKGFVMVALGMPYPQSGIVDVWSINEKKELILLADSTAVDVFSVSANAAPGPKLPPASPAVINPVPKGTETSDDILADAMIQKTKLHLKCEKDQINVGQIGVSKSLTCKTHEGRRYKPVVILLSSGLMCFADLKEGKLSGYLRCYDQGILKIERFYREGTQDGLEKGFSEKGNILYKQRFKNGKPDGLYTVYDEHENELVKISYKDGKKHGPATYFNPETKKRSLYVIWENDEPKNGRIYDESGKGKSLRPDELRDELRKFEAKETRISKKVDT